MKCFAANTLPITMLVVLAVARIKADFFAAVTEITDLRVQFLYFLHKLVRTAASHSSLGLRRVLRFLRMTHGKGHHDRG